MDGKVTMIDKKRTKTKSSYRTLPLVKPFEELLLRMKAEQETNRRVCGSAYCRKYLDYIYVNELGELVRPNFITQNFAIVLANNKLKKIRFHDLRHSCASLLYAHGVSLKEIYPLTTANCAQVTACGIRTRHRYSTVVSTSATGGAFRMLGRPACSPDYSLAAIDGTAPTEGGATT